MGEHPLGSRDVDGEAQHAVLPRRHPGAQRDQAGGGGRGEGAGQLAELTGAAGQHRGQQRRVGGQLRQQLIAQPVDQHHRQPPHLADPLAQPEGVGCARDPEQRGRRRQDVADRAGLKNGHRLSLPPVYGTAAGWGAPAGAAALVLALVRAPPEPPEPPEPLPPEPLPPDPLPVLGMLTFGTLGMLPEPPSCPASAGASAVPSAGAAPGVPCSTRSSPFSGSLSTPGTSKSPESAGRPPGSTPAAASPITVSSRSSRSARASGADSRQQPSASNAVTTPRTEPPRRRPLIRPDLSRSLRRARPARRART